MGRPTSFIAKIIFEYLDKWPNLPNLTLAKKIYKENSKAFTGVEHVRSIIRRYKGRNGEDLRKSLKLRKYFDNSELYKNPYQLPNSEAEDDTVFTIPAQYNRIGLMADMHIPYHDVEAMTVAIDHFINFGANAIIIDGDAIDFYSLSRFDKDPRNRDVSYELDCLANVIKTLQQNFGKVFYKKGNHEERYERYLRIKAPELLNVSEFQFENLLAQRGVNCEVIQHTKIMAGKLPIVHGHEFQSASTSIVNPARGLMLKGYTHGITAHAHRSSQHTEKDLMGKLLVCFSIGCLCGLSPEWARLNKWNHGIATIELEESGAFDVENLRIHKGRTRK